MYLPKSFLFPDIRKAVIPVHFPTITSQPGVIVPTLLFHGHLVILTSRNNIDLANSIVEDQVRSIITAWFGTRSVVLPDGHIVAGKLQVKV